MTGSAVAQQHDPIARLRDDGPLVALVRRVVPLPAGLALLVAVAAATASGALVLTALLAAPGSAGSSILPIALPVWLAGLLAAGGRPSPRLGWLVPSLVQAVELGLVVAVVRPPSVALALALALALHHYGIVYRARAGTEDGRAVRWTTWRGLGGWDVRVGLVLLGAAVDRVEPLSLVLAAVVASVAVAAAVWTGRALPTGTVPGGPGRVRTHPAHHPG